MTDCTKETGDDRIKLALRKLLANARRRQFFRKNADHLAISPGLRAMIAQLVMNGRMPHHLVIASSSEVYLHYEGIESDSQAIALAGGFDSQIEHRNVAGTAR